MHAAAENGNEEMVLLLREHGSEVKCTVKVGLLVALLEMPKLTE